MHKICTENQVRFGECILKLSLSILINVECSLVLNF